MASRFRDFSRGVGGSRGTATLGGLSTSTSKANALDIQIDAAGIFDFFEQRDQDKADRKFANKNAEILGLTPDEVDTLSRKDLRSLKSELIRENASKNIDALARSSREKLVGEDTGDFISLLGQGNAEVDPLEALLNGDTLPNLPSPERTQPILDGIDVLGLGGEETQPRFPPEVSDLTQPIPVEAVQPDNFGEFVEEETSPSRTPIQQLQDALVQLRPRQAARIQETPFFQGLLKIATKNPRVGQLVQDAEGNMWNITFDREGNVKKQVKLNIKKAPSSLKNTTKILQSQNKDGSIGMEAVTFDSSGKLIRREPLPGIIPKSFKVELDTGLTKAAKTRAQVELQEITTNIENIDKLIKVFEPGGIGEEMLSTPGRVENFMLGFADTLGVLDPSRTLGSWVKAFEDVAGSGLQETEIERLKVFREARVLAETVVVAFQKEITGVAGPPETFERLKAISTDASTLGPIGMRTTLGLMRKVQQDIFDLKKDAFLSRNKKEFIAALEERTNVRLDEYRLAAQSNLELLEAIDRAEAKGIKAFNENLRKRGKKKRELSVTPGLNQVLDGIIGLEVSPNG